MSDANRVILDACSVVSLYGTRHMMEIVGTLPRAALIAEAVTA